MRALEASPSFVDTRSVQARLRAETGFGLIELLIAMTMLNIGVLAIVAAFNSGMISLQRASRISTATALADIQMELYRALTYSSIKLDTDAATGADSVYKSDPAWSAALITETCAGVPNECNPSRVAVGADGRQYRVDTYSVAHTPTNGRSVKLVTVVVRDAANLATTFARQASAFDQSTG
jgi:type II secretory pathway pseudopilin PulG